MVQKHTILLLLMLVSGTWGFQTHWIFLTNDDTRQLVALTPKALARMELRGQPSPPGNLSLSTQHIRSLQRAGFKIRHTSRFLNAVSIEIDDPADLLTIKALPFVKSTKPVAIASKIQPYTSDDIGQLTKSSTLDYGESGTQNDMLHIPSIHDKGYDGSGILIGVFDTGFNTDHDAFSDLDVRAQYDFIDNESDASGPGHSHGIAVLSVLAGYDPESLIGPAHGASYLLARTEDDYSESRLEEDHWVAALEWADSLGVDIISSSLNYRDEFDDPLENYPFSAIDVHGARVVSALAQGGATTSGLSYLATFSVRVPDNVSGPLRVVLRRADTHLQDSMGGDVGVAPSAFAAVTVQPLNQRPPKCPIALTATR